MAHGIRLKDESTGEVISALRNDNSEARTYTLQDDTGTLAFQSNRGSCVWVESDGSDTTGAAGKPDRPFATINAALDALPSTGGVIYLGIGDFDAPTDDIDSGAVDNNSKLKDNVAFIGAKRPWVNSAYTVGTFPSSTAAIAAPTALTGGTVIKGPMHFVGRNRIIMMNLGVDVGSAYCTAQSLANGDNCLAFVDSSSIAGTQVPTEVNFGLLIENVVTLGKDASAAFHGLTVGSVLSCRVDGLYTFFNTWGLAIKAQQSQFKNIYAHGHTNGGIVVKGDVYAPCQQNIVDGFVIRQIGTAGGGFQVESGTDPIYRNIFSNGLIFDCSYGVKVIGNENVDSNTFHNIRALNNDGDGFDLSGNNIQYNEFINCDAVGNGGIGFDITTTAGITTLKNCRAYANVSDGVKVAASCKVYAPGIFCRGNGGFGINNAGTVYRYERLYSGNTSGGEGGEGTYTDSNSSTQV